MNRRNFKLPPVYPITDARLSGFSHAEQVRRLCDGGATLIQLREKHLSPREFYADAEQALKAAREYGAKIIINDRADIALALGADGAHLGQDDLPPDAARALLGADAILGFSTHNIPQAVAAAALPLDYAAIGPVFTTNSKTNPDPVVGLVGVAAVRAEINALPLVAIGGVTRANAGQVFAAGADSLALISELLSEPQLIAQRMKEILKDCSRFQPG